MPGLQWINSPRFFYFLIGVYALFALINLQYLPVVWLDEAANLEPALNYINKGQYAAKSWATPGAEEVFLSYPPAISWLHILSLKIFPFSVFWIRFPFLILHLVAVLLLYQVLNKYIKIKAPGAAILASFFLFDKAVFEISRAVRAETIMLFLLALLFIFYYRKANPFFIGFIIGLLILTHLNAWPMAGIFGLYYLFFQRPKQWPLFLIAALLPVILYLIFIDFNVHGLYQQMFVYSGEHAAKGNIWIRVQNGFLFRFFPVYKEQPWLPILHLLMVFAAIRGLVKSKGSDIWSAIFIVADLIQMLAMSANYRYWIPVYFVGIIVLAQYLKEVGFGFKIMLQWYFIPVYLLLLYPFLSRHTLGFLQRPERNPDEAVRFLEKNIPNAKNTLVFGDEIGLYMAGKYPQLDFGHTLEPDHFNFKDYQKIYYLSHQNYSQLHCLDSFQPPTLHLPQWTYKLGKGGTYSGMKIYLIRSEKEWKSVAKNYYLK